MGHANDDVLDAVVDAAIDQGLHARHKGFATLKTKALVVGEFRGKEALEAGTPDQTVQNATLLVDRVLVRLGDLNAIADPVAGLAVGDVDVLDAVGTGVDLLARGDDLTEGHLLPGLGLEAREDAGAKVEILVEILLRESIVVKLQLSGLVVSKGLLLATDAQGVDLGLVVSAGLVRADEELDLQVVGDVVAGGRANLGHMLGDTAGGGGDDGGRRLEGLRDGHAALFHVVEVRAPGNVDTLGVLFPRKVHLIDVVGGAALEERVIGILDQNTVRQYIYPRYQLHLQRLYSSPRRRPSSVSVVTRRVRHRPKQGVSGWSDILRTSTTGSAVSRGCVSSGCR